MKGDKTTYLMACVAFFTCFILSFVALAEEYLRGTSYVKMSTCLLVIISLLSTIISTLTFYLVIKKSDVEKSIYISFSPIYSEQADKIMRARKGTIFYSQFTIEPGSTIKNSIKTSINNSSYCIVLIGNEISQTQTFEIKMMKHMKKRIIPILISSDNTLPSYLSGIKAVLYDNFINNHDLI